MTVNRFLNYSSQKLITLLRQLVTHLMDLDQFNSQVFR